MKSFSGDRRRSCAGVAIAALATGVFAMSLPCRALAENVDREFHYTVTVDAQQSWHKNDPKYPGDQTSQANGQQRYELTTRLRSDRKLQVRNLLDPNMPARLEAKTIFLAREAKKYLQALGLPVNPPHTAAERSALSNRMQADIDACHGEPRCNSDTTMRYAAIFAAVEYPEALEEDTVPGRYLYFLAYDGCPEKSRVTLNLAIDGVRYNKDVDKLVPFSERRSADTVDASDGLRLCDHFTAVIDTQDKARGMYMENVFVPRPVGMTDYTERNHTSHTQEPQPMPPAVLEWLDDTLRHAPPSGSASTTLPLALSLNGNSTWLGLWTGTAKVKFDWSFTEVPSAPGH